MKTNNPVYSGQVLEFAEQHIEEYLSGDFSLMYIIQELKNHPHQGEYNQKIDARRFNRAERN